VDNTPSLPGTILYNSPLFNYSLPPPPPPPPPPNLEFRIFFFSKRINLLILKIVKEKANGSSDEDSLNKGLGLTLNLKHFKLSIVRYNKIKYKSAINFYQPHIQTKYLTIKPINQTLILNRGENL
jgi:hypothetical protein